MDKQCIINEIKRTAEENGGKALGMDRFLAATGIRPSDWHGKYWARWGDAIEEAGFKPNKLQGSYEDEFVIEKMVSFIRELGKYPVKAELKMKARGDSDFPSHTVFDRIGKKAAFAGKVIEYCISKGELDDIIEICKPIARNEDQPRSVSTKTRPDYEGWVYLIKSGHFYKIGKTADIGRREYELKMQLPEKPKTMHKIKTDDPKGIEEYWHKRFQDKRQRGEWFDLSQDDVNAFKRRKYM